MPKVLDDSKRHYSDFLEANKKVTEADKKFVEKYIVPKMHNSLTTVRNPLSGYESQTTPLLETLIRFTQNLIYTDFRPDVLHYWGVSEGSKIQLFDRARMLVLKLDKDIYMNVLD